MIRRGALALLLLAAVACPAGKEQSIAPKPETAEALYARGRAAVGAADYDEARRIANVGQTRFAAQPHWRELFMILYADALVRTDRPSAQDILEKAPATGSPEALVRRLLTSAMGERSDKKYAEADARAARVFPALRLEIAAWRNFDLAMAEVGNKQYAQAIDYFNRAAQAAHIARLGRVEIPAKTKAGWYSMELGDLDQATAYLTPVTNDQTQPPYQHTSLVNMAEIFVRRLEFDKALPYAQRARAVAEGLTPKECANSYLQIGQIELELGHYKDAELWIEKALKTRPAGDEVGAFYDQWNQARIYAATGRQSQALALLKNLLDLPAAKNNRELRWRVQGIEAEIFAKLGRLPEAEKKYRDTLDTGAAARKDVSNSTELFAFERNFTSFYEGYIELLLAQGRKIDALRIAESSRARALLEKAQLDIDPIDLARRKNATILCYWLGAKRSLLWVVTPQGIDVVDNLPADDVIDKAADAYRQELQSPRRQATKSELGMKLYTMLVAPARIARGTRVIILPDAHLNGLSFDALLVPAQPPHYWIDDVTVSYAPALQVVDAPPWQPPREARALLFGDVPAEGTQFPKLARAGEEIDEVQRHFGARAVVLRGKAATPSAYVSASPKDFQFLHFATHATATMDAPLDSAVVMAPDRNGFNLSGKNIIGVPLTAELVTISGCNSAGRRNFVGEGLVGLAWAFLRAGAHRVVAAQWEVNDAAAARMMNAMYTAMIDRGLEPAEALRQAKLELRRAGGVYERPLYWAPFAVYGAL